MNRFLACVVCVFIATLGGCGDEPVSPPALTPIQGRIEDTDGQPVPGVIVLVGDKSPVTSDPAGSFHVDGVGSTYDVALLFDSTEARIYSSITSRDPFFRVAPRMATTRSARIMGVVPAAPGQTTMVAFAPNNPTGAGTIADPNTGAFTLYVFWTTSRTSVEGTMCVIRWTVGADGLPADYDAFGRRELVLAEGSTTIQGFAPAALSDPPEAQISGSVAIPNGYRLLRIDTLMHMGMATFWFVRQDPQAVDGSYEFTLPLVPDAIFSVEATASSGSTHTSLRKNGIVPPTSGIVLDLPASPQIVAPPRGASNVDYSTLLQWSDSDGTGPYVVHLNPFGRPQLVIFLKDRSMRIPDFSDYGLGLPAGTFCPWILYKLFPISSVDEVVTTVYGTALASAAGNAHSGYSHFTTRP